MTTSTIRIGSISTGTLRIEDLIPAYQELADSLGLAIAPLADDEDAYDFLADLDDRINGVLPDYLRFGAIEGDGADIGIWPLDGISEELADALLAADAAADGDSNDDEIAALRDALQIAVASLVFGVND
jgi:hypothetical protein